MPRVRFISDFDYKIPGMRGVIAYRAGVSLRIPRDHFTSCREAGACVEIPEQAKNVEEIGKYTGSTEESVEGVAGEKRKRVDGYAEKTRSEG